MIRCPNCHKELIMETLFDGEIIFEHKQKNKECFWNNERFDLDRVLIHFNEWFLEKEEKYKKIRES